ncbi:MetQ/NlpA family ABC transporter substrate-binding protein [Sutterella sp.]|uniref:MetQ/NlpA family ABC transporter substrate-binding protein n=1 Tax=Sutterella sp. TaxID=1981025 RepID=UPI0026E01E9A|nr:MetQ/NlpA family ABC transporter substrate-binding protein [Sutterella sp.]MDO5532852.1 MetQ/NlpA family ABC transporter substrate-binding protein [Sutterella sp.]
MQRRKLFTAGAAALAALTLPAAAVQAAENTVIRVGVTAGPAAEVLEKVVPLAAKRGLTVKIFEFQDYITPNVALDAGDLDANIFQTKVFLENQNEQRGFKMRIVAPAFTLPMAYYSKKIKDLKDLPTGATVGIPNDAPMGGRALILLASSGIIKLRDGTGLLPTKFDIIENPKKIKVIELEAAQLPQALDDLTIAGINGNYAAVTGLNPTRDGLLVEGPKGPYVCNIAVDEKNVNAPWVKPFVEAYQSKEIHDWIIEFYKGTVIPAF